MVGMSATENQPKGAWMLVFVAFAMVTTTLVAVLVFTNQGDTEVLVAGTDEENERAGQADPDSTGPSEGADDPSTDPATSNLGPGSTSTRAAEPSGSGPRADGPNAGTGDELVIPTRRLDPGLPAPQITEGRPTTKAPTPPSTERPEKDAPAQPAPATSDAARPPRSVPDREWSVATSVADGRSGEGELVTAKGQAGPAEVEGRRFVGAFLCASGAEQLAPCNRFAGSLASERFDEIPESGGAFEVAVTLSSLTRVSDDDLPCGAGTAPADQGDCTVLDCSTPDSCELVVADVDVALRTDRASGLELADYRIIHQTSAQYHVATVEQEATLDLRPDGRLRDGDDLTLSVSGFEPGEGQVLDVCADGTDCYEVATFQLESPTDSEDLALRAHRWMFDLDCVLVSCSIGRAGDNGGRVELEFDPTSGVAPTASASSIQTTGADDGRPGTPHVNALIRGKGFSTTAVHQVRVCATGGERRCALVERVAREVSDSPSGAVAVPWVRSLGNDTQWADPDAQDGAESVRFEDASFDFTLRVPQLLEPADDSGAPIECIEPGSCEIQIFAAGAPHIGARVPLIGNET